MRDLERKKIIDEYDKIQEHEKWVAELPPLHFEKEWDVLIIPPMHGAIIRFAINYNKKHISAWFDAYGEITQWKYENGNPVPHFGYYDGEKCRVYFMDESERMMEDIRKYLNS